MTELNQANCHSSSQKIRLSLTRDYAKSWKVWEGLREILQNWYDGLLSAIDQISKHSPYAVNYNSEMTRPIIKKKFGLNGLVEYIAYFNLNSSADIHNSEEVIGRVVFQSQINALHLINTNTGLARKVLLLGYSDKSSRRDVIGQFGEGLKVGALALVREGRQIAMETGEDRWSFFLEKDQMFGEEVLTIEVSSRREDQIDFDMSYLSLTSDDTCLSLYPLTAVEWDRYSKRFLFLETLDSKDCIKTESGWLILHPNYSGQLFVRQIWVSDLSNDAGGMSAGVNLHRLKLDRDRRSVLHQSDMDHTVSAMWSRAISIYPALAERYYRILINKGDNSCDTRHALFYMEDQNLAKQIAREFFKVNGEGAYPVSNKTNVADLTLLNSNQNDHNIVLCDSTLVNILMKSGHFLSNEEYLSSKNSNSTNHLLAEHIHISQLISSEQSILRHACQAVCLSYPTVTTDHVIITNIYMSNVRITEVGLIHIPLWMLNATSVCNYFSVLPPCNHFCIGFLTVSLLNSLKQDIGHFQTNFQMVSGVTYSQAIIIGNLIGQACDKIVPPSCAVLHGDQTKLIIDEAINKEKVLLSKMQLRENYYTQRESAHIERFLVIQSQVSSLESDIASGEEKFLDSQSALINTYDEKLTRIQEQARLETTKHLEKIEDLTGEISRLNDLSAESIREVTELNENNKRSTSILKERLIKIQTILAHRNADLLELMTLKDGSEISEGRIRELLNVFKEEIEQIEKKNLCIVCCSSNKEILLMPCKHHHLCSNCADAVNNCPYCRSCILERIKVFS